MTPQNKAAGARRPKQGDGSNAKQEQLAAFTSDNTPQLSTNQGLQIPDNHNSLKAGVARADAARRLHPAREDHALRPRAHSRARGARARRGGARPLSGLQVDVAVHLRRLPAGPCGQDAGVRALLDRGRLARLGRHGARRARLRGQVLHARGQLRPGGQQHPGVLHPGCDQVPRPDPRRQARAAPRDAAGRQRARHLLGLRLADARDHAHADVGHERPRHPAQLAHDGRLRRPHLPLRQRARRERISSSSTGSPSSASTAWPGTRRRRSPARTPTSIAATCGRPSSAATSPSGSWACS